MYKTGCLFKFNNFTPISGVISIKYNMTLNLTINIMGKAEQYFSEFNRV